MSSFSRRSYPRHHCAFLALSQFLVGYIGPYSYVCGTIFWSINQLNFFARPLEVINAMVVKVQQENDSSASFVLDITIYSAWTHHFRSEFL